MKPVLSIIMPTYARPELLNLGLKSLMIQQFLVPYEIIVLNDYIPDESEAICNSYKDRLNIKYMFVGQRNLESLKWRVPGAVFNEGVKLAQGEFLILTSAEMYHLDNRNVSFLLTRLYHNSKLLTIPYGKDDDGRILDILKRGNNIPINLYDNLKNLNTKLPFCMGISKKQFESIGGFDPAFFEGYCFDDDDFVDRLLKDNCQYFQSDAKVIHLYHSRLAKDRIGLNNRNELWVKNQRIYISKQLSDKTIKKELKDIIPIKTVEEAMNEPLLPDKVNLPLDLSVGTPLQGDNGVNQEIIPPKSEQKPEVLPQPIETKEVLIIKEPDIIKDKWYLEKTPKIAHFYWGEEKLPYLRYLTIWSFYKYNSGWEIRFYYPKYRQKGRAWKTHEHRFEFTGKDYYNKLHKLPIKFIEIDFELIGFKNNVSEVYKANYLEYYLLYMIGGLFSDTDIIYFKSINNLFINKPENRNITNIFSILWHGHTMGFLLSSPNNDIYKYLLNKVSIYFEKLKDDYQCIGTLMINKELGTEIKQIQNKFPNLNIYNLLPKTIYAYDIGKIKEIFELKDIKGFVDYSIGLHWYGGFILSMKAINKLNGYNIKENSLFEKIIEVSLGKRELNMNNSEKLTIHCVVRNEPFIYYCIKASYPYAKKILLYDTGSYDKHTLEDIQKLLEEDKDKKIIFKQIPIDSDETQWTMQNLKDLEKQNKGKFNLGSVRQLMINDTSTEFFLILDADEVHYKQTMETIVNDIIPNFPEDIYLIATPLNWFYDLTHTFYGAYTFPFSGGIYRTDKVVMNSISPNEHHLIKETGEILCTTKYKMNWTEGLIPYAHFETFLKPWRRKGLIKPEQIIEFKGKLPEVMEKNPYYIERFLKENK
jgi:hypothetical protein